MEKKEDYILKKKEKILADKKALEEKKLKEKDQKQIASKAFEQWLVIKAEKEKEKKEEAQHTEKKTEKQKRVETKSQKPPLPFEAWLVYF